MPSANSIPQIQSICCSLIPIPLPAEEEDVCLLLMDVRWYGGLVLALCLCQKRKLKAEEDPAPGVLLQHGGEPLQPQPPPGGGNDH